MNAYEVFAAHRDIQEYTQIQLQSVKFAGEKVVLEGKVVDIYHISGGLRVDVKVRDMLVRWDSPYGNTYSSYKQNSEIKFEGTINRQQYRGTLTLTDVTVKT